MPYFERNRLLMACNYKISTASTFQLGLLHQFDFKLNDETGTSFLVVGYYFELFKNSSTNLDKTHELKDN